MYPCRARQVVHMFRITTDRAHCRIVCKELDDHICTHLVPSAQPAASGVPAGPIGAAPCSRGEVVCQLHHIMHSKGEAVFQLHHVMCACLIMQSRLYPKTMRKHACSRVHVLKLSTAGIQPCSGRTWGPAEAPRLLVPPLL